MMFVTAAFLFTFPLLLQLTFEYSAIQTGLALMPYSIATLITALAGSRLSSRFTAKRIIQVGFLVAIAGLAFIEASIKPGLSPSDLASGALYGAGLGLVASQILNYIYSSVSSQDTPETTGLTGTFEQLGNAMGVALVGVIMLSLLSPMLIRGLEESAVIPPEQREAMARSVDSGVELVSDTQLTQSMQAAGADDTVQAEVREIYGFSRTDAFKAGIAFLLFVAVAGLILTTGMTNRKLVEAEASGS
jgi:fucose permease